MHPPKHQRGFTFTETLVALVASLVVLRSVMDFAVSAMRSNAQFVAGARVLQQMRQALNLVTGEIRRAGYYDDAARFVPSAAQAGLSDMPVIRSPSCIIVRYDRQGPLFHAYRYAAHNGVGVIQTTTSRGVEPDCDGSTVAGTWRDLTDPALIDVQEFSFAPATDAGGCTSLHDYAVIVQDIDVRLKATKVGSPMVARELSETARVRNDIMASGSCT